MNGFAWCDECEEETERCSCLECASCSCVCRDGNTRCPTCGAVPNRDDVSQCKRADCPLSFTNV